MIVLKEALITDQRKLAVVSSVGGILAINGLLMLLATVISVLIGDNYETIRSFFLPAFGQLVIGIVTWFAFQPVGKFPLSRHEGGIIVVISWLLVCVCSAIPFMRGANMAFTQAFFESVSGWTTTGLSVMVPEETTTVFLIWRSLMQLAGGAGLAIIMLAAIITPFGPSIATAEGRTDQLVPHVRRSARLVAILYLGYLLAGTTGLWCAGMSGFDAFNHTCAAISTGGFSTHSASIGFWDNPFTELILIVLMLLGNMNFVNAWLLFQGKFRAFRQNGEIRLLAVILILAIPLSYTLTCRNLYPDRWKAFRVSVFEVISAITTTGFSTVGYGNWNAFGIHILVLLMLIGGGICSTAGGIKQYRIYILFQSTLREIRRMFLPKKAVFVHRFWEGDKETVLDDRQICQINAYVVLYLFTFAIGTGILAAHGYGLQESMFEFASALGTVGLSIGITSAQAPPMVLWTEITGMLLGRLEFFVIFLSLMRLWRPWPWA